MILAGGIANWADIFEWSNWKVGFAPPQFSWRDKSLALSRHAGLRVRKESSFLFSKEAWAGLSGSFSDLANHSPAVSLMLGLEGGIGAITLGALRLGPGHEQGEAHAMEESQDRGRVVVADAQPIFHGRTVQALMGPVFNAPIIPVGPQKVLGGQLGGLAIGDQPDRFGLGRGGDFLRKSIAQEQTIELGQFLALECSALESEGFRAEHLVWKTGWIVERRTFGQLVQSLSQGQGGGGSQLRGVRSQKCLAHFGGQGGAECFGQIILRSG